MGHRSPLLLPPVTPGSDPGSIGPEGGPLRHDIIVCLCDKIMEMDCRVEPDNDRGKGRVIPGGDPGSRIWFPT